jgi:hypothetical protein
MQNGSMGKQKYKVVKIVLRVAFYSWKRFVSGWLYLELQCRFFCPQEVVTFPDLIFVFYFLVQHTEMVGCAAY